MNRRQYLFRTGAGVGTLTALAGCLGSLPGSGSDVTVHDRTGERALDRAAGALNVAAIELQVTDDTADDPENVEFDPAVPTESIEEGRGHLETAAAELDADRQPDVETLETYADVLEGLVSVIEAVTDEGFTDDADDVFAATGGDGDLEAAADTLEGRIAELDATRTRHDEATAAFAGLDADRFERLARIDRSVLEDAITTLGGVLDSLETLGSGLDATLEGYEDLERGREYFEDGAYEQASAAFVDAESAFDAATATLEADEETPAGLESQFETARCQSESLSDGANAFADAADAGARGDAVTADQHLSDAERALEDAADCTE